MRSALAGCLLLFAGIGLAAPSPAPGAQWESSQLPISPEDENASLGVSSRNVIVDSSDRVHLLYQKNLEGDIFQIYYTVRETDGTWSPEQLVSPAGENARNAGLALDHDGRLHAVWEDISNAEGDIVHRARETDGTWGTIESISPAEGFSRHPVATVDAFNRLHVVWVDGRGSVQKILHSSRDADGTVWDEARSLSQGAIGPIEPNVDADGIGVVHVSWAERGSIQFPRPSFDVMYMRLDGSGNETPLRLVEHGGVAIRPFIEAMEDGTVHVVWMDDRDGGSFGYSEIYYRRYLPGIGWGKDKRFSYDASDHDRPIIIAGPANTLNLVWEDYRDGAPDIFYRQITHEFGWDPRATQLTNDLSSSVAPSLAVLSSGRLILLWSDAQGSGSFRINTKEGDIQ